MLVRSEMQTRRRDGIVAVRYWAPTCCVSYTLTSYYGIHLDTSSYSCATHNTVDRSFSIQVLNCCPRTLKRGGVPPVRTKA